MAFQFEGKDIVTMRDIRDTMKDIMATPKKTLRVSRAKTFADGYRAADPNANGNMGQAAGYLGDQYSEACELFGVEHWAFGGDTPQDVGQRLKDEDTPA